jgi:zinc D-Ala-D-Ala dipeptidase
MRCFIVLAMLVVAENCLRAQSAIPLVDIKSVDPTIVIELRYAGANNLAGRALNPGTPALVRPEVALRLVAAQASLRHYNYGLKIWDAYRPASVQMQLWQAAHKNHDYVADPQTGAGSLHSWGVAVDATLVDRWHRPVLMPTDFDNFTPAAMWHYRGADPAIRSHLHLLQTGMRDAGFYGQPIEWWHFVIADWQKYLPRKEAERAMQAWESGHRASYDHATMFSND